MKRMKGFVLLAFYTLLCGVVTAVAQNEERGMAPVHTCAELTYGDWYGATTEHIPTLITTHFYDSNGNKVVTTTGRYQLGDSETTPEVEEEGEIRPETFLTYKYSPSGKLLQVYQRKYTAINGYFSGWNEGEVIEWYVYDEMDRPVKGKKGSDNYTYEWSGDTLVAETDTTDLGTWEYTKRYSNFVEGTIDCPQYVFQTGKYNNYIIENVYDEHCRKVSSMTYKIANAIKDSLGVILSGEKGMAYMKQEWSYDENGDLMAELKSYWNNGKGMFQNDSKIEYVLSDEEGGTVVTTYQYSIDHWVKFGYPKVFIEKPYQKSGIVTDLSIKEVSDAPNSVTLSFYPPEDVPQNAAWEVYRNGVPVGKTHLSAGKMVYADNELQNGKWTYFVKAIPQDSTMQTYVSNLVEKEFDTQLPAVTNVTCIASGKYDSNFAYHLVWDSPETNLTIKGYNVVFNPKSYDKNPPAYNEELITEPNYVLQLSSYDNVDNTIIIETVYNVGFVRSEPFVFTLDTDNSIAVDFQEKTKAIYTYGDVMGTADASQPTKVEQYFYDAEGKLMRKFTGGILTSDDPDTKEVEKKGDIVPISYLMYYYDELNRISQVKERKYGVFSGYDRVWSDDIKKVEEYSYDDNGKLIGELKDGNFTYEYEWEGDNIVKETKKSLSSSTIKTLYTMTFGDFVPGKTNLPQYALKVAAAANLPAHNRVYEMQYDAKGHLVKKNEYKHGENVRTNEDGVIVAADKGQIAVEETWTYEGDNMTQYEKKTWKSSADTLVPTSKTIYTHTARGVVIQSYSYTSTTGTEGWNKSAVHTQEVNGFYYKDSAPRDLKITALDSLPNSVALSCRVPAKNYAKDPVYEVYRNGELIGTAIKKAGKIYYEDLYVPNGVWDYYIKVKSFAEGVDFYTTNVVEMEFNTELPIVQNVKFPLNGKDGEGKYLLQVTWEAPETDLEIVGYNVFSDIKSYTKNPSPDNGLYPISADTCFYNFIWSSIMKNEKTICVEVVYNIGKAKTENIPVTLNESAVAVKQIETLSSMKYSAETLYMSGEYDQVVLYSANGVRLGVYQGQKNIPLNHLPHGLYVAVLRTADSQSTLKFIK